MNSSHTKQVVWITGAASGVGKHLTKSFLQREYYVLATDIRIEKLDRVAQQENWQDHKVALRRQDISNPHQWQQLRDELLSMWGKWDYLLNVAAILKPSYTSDVSLVDIDQHIDINVKGVIHGCRVAAETMTKTGHGHIINFGSLAGIAPIPGIGLYSTSKFAVRGFTLALAQELRPKGVSVSLVSPDVIKTPMSDRQLDYPEACMTFSGSKILSLQDIEHAIFKHVLIKAPFELTIPVSRGVTAKLASFFPGVIKHLGPMLAKKGIAQQAAQLKLR